MFRFGRDGSDMRPDQRHLGEPPNVFVDSELQITIEAFLSRFRHERGGVLLGEHDGGRTLLTAAIFPTQQLASGLACSFESSVIDIVREALEPFNSSRSGLRPWSIVGWIHSHPHLGVFLSRQDLQTLTSWTDLDSGTVAMVVDPHSRRDQIGVWGRGGRQLGVEFRHGSDRSLSLTDGALLAGELRAVAGEDPAMFWGVVCSNGVVDVRPRQSGSRSGSQSETGSHD